MPSVEGVDDNMPPKGYGVSGQSKSGDGVAGQSDTGVAVSGESITGIGMFGISIGGAGVVGQCDIGDGVAGSSTYSDGVAGLSLRGSGVSGNSFTGSGLHGESRGGVGVRGFSFGGDGVKGFTMGGIGTVGSVGVRGCNKEGVGVRGHSESGIGVLGISGPDFVPTHGITDMLAAVFGYSDINTGVYGESNTSTGVWGISASGDGVHGHSGRGIALNGFSGIGTAVYGYSAWGYAARLDGKVSIAGPLEKPGGSFKIDHPLDPANKYLHHSFVESPDMKNVYDGVVALDDKGEAEIDLPNWFGALNKDFRYQLTAIGAPGPNLYIAEEISGGSTDHSDTSSKNNNNRFKIAGGTSGMKVSWQVTGIRKDPWANAHRVQVEEEKPDKERGYYIYPDLYGQPEEKGISHLLFPKKKEQELLSSRKWHKPTL